MKSLILIAAICLASPAFAAGDLTDWFSEKGEPSIDAPPADITPDGPGIDHPGFAHDSEPRTADSGDATDGGVSPGQQQ